MSQQGLSNKPKLRVKVAKKYNLELQAKKIQGDIHSRSSVDRGYKYSFERTYPKRIDQFNKSYQSGKPVYNNPNKPNPKISLNTGKNYSETAIGDVVNVASRLESSCKDLKCQLVASKDVMIAAGLSSSLFSSAKINVKGRKGKVNVYTIKDASKINMI